MKRELQIAAAGIVLVGLLVLIARHGSSQPANSDANGSGTAATASAPDANDGSSGANGSAADGSGATGGGSPGFLARLVHSEKSFTLRQGTRIDVRLLNTIGSSRNRSGDSFRATVDQPIEVNGAVIAPRGSTVTGEVVSARPSGHLKTPPELAVTLTSLEVGGKHYEITTSTDSWRGRSHKKHDAKWIGGLAGAGALVGALAGHGEGAAIGAAAGAGAGTAGAYATGKHDITLASETRLRFVLRRPVTVTASGS